MAPSTDGGAQIVREVAARRLAATSDLFEHGKITSATRDDKFILRLNTLVHADSQAWSENVPANLEDAIRADRKEARPQAELILFGHWLLLDGRPGLQKTSGRKPDDKEIMKCVAACLFGLRLRKRRERHKGRLVSAASTNVVSRSSLPRPNSRTKDITKHDLRDWWMKLFDESRKASDFDAKLKSMPRLLHAYLSHLQSGTVTHGSKTVTKSPRMCKVLASIADKTDVQPKQQQAQPAPVPAAPEPFSIPLSYSSPTEKAECRGASGCSLPDATLEYRCTSASSTSESGNTRPDRAGKLVLAPDLAVRGNYKIEALIDRIAILVSTMDKREEKALNKQIETVTGRSVLVRDLTKPRKCDSWGKPLPVPDLSKSTGYHFGILIQDPAPEMLAAILTAIRDGPGIEGPVTFHMVEVSVDFYPKTNDPQEAILRRERMVGAIQRHHWTPHAHFMDKNIVNPRHIDARQIYHDPENPAGEGEPKLRYLFSQEKSRSLAKIPDCRIGISDIRKRILTNLPGEPLYLNSTLAKGDRRNGFSHVSIQHKVADQRNREKETKTVLPDHERRARVEVTLSGSDRLKERGLETIDDLGKVSFRRLTKPFLSFSLGTTDSWQHLLDDAQAQMHTRGVYGLELRHRARALEERERLRASGQTVPRDRDREGLGLIAWQEMNEVIGKAQDELTRRWRRFSWR